jgi:molecular chaperone DnaJ
MKLDEARQILEIDQNASEEDIKKAFRKKAASAHPDRNPNDANAEEKFKNINKAYQILSGTEKAEDDISQNINSEIFYQHWHDMFNNFFGNREVIERDDIGLRLMASFKECVLGGEREIDFNRQVYCKDCNGKGLEQNSITKCSHCQGAGVIRKSITNGPVRQIFQQACQHCRGTGFSGFACKKCAGNGFLVLKKTLKLKIPPIGDRNTTLMIHNQGNEYANGVVSNVLIDVIPTSQEANMTIDGNNVFSKEAVSLDILLFGGELKVKLIDGEETIKIPPESKLGSMIPIYGRGVKAGKFKQAGNHMVELDLKYPKNLTEDLKAALINAYK